MKISSGDYKYRNIEVPRDIRPTTEKVREAVFSMIRDWTYEATVLDLFAGSGSLGLEALSRGASKCYFNEINRKNYKVLLSNIANCKAGDRALVSNRDYEACIHCINDRIDVVFLDPPYHDFGFYANSMMLLQEDGLIDTGSIVVAEHLYEYVLAEEYGRLRRIKEKKYGTIGVDVFLMVDELPEKA